MPSRAPSRTALWLRGPRLARPGSAAPASCLLGRFGSFANGLPEPRRQFRHRRMDAAGARRSARPSSFFFVLAALYRPHAGNAPDLARHDRGRARLAEPEVAGADSRLVAEPDDPPRGRRDGRRHRARGRRAGELETIVRGEISTLERAYADNEIRLRSLIDELVTQREAVVGNAERVEARDQRRP